MAASPRRFASFRDGLKAAIEEEISGAAYFATLADHLGGRAADALGLFVRIEQSMIAASAEVAARHGLLETLVSDLRSEGRAEALAHVPAGWKGFLARVIADYPAFIAEFEWVRARAGAEDRAATDLLVAHEVALLDFARREISGDPDSFAPLEGFLDSLALSAPRDAMPEA